MQAHRNPSGADSATERTGGLLAFRLTREQADYLRRMVFDDIATQAAYIAENAKAAADQIDNRGHIGDTRSGRRLLEEGFGILDRLGWEATS